MYSNLTKQREDFVSGMFVRNVINDLKQHELSMPTISRVGRNSLKNDMIGLMVVCCVGNVITPFTENTNLKH
jgi:hypothetical protein